MTLSENDPRLTAYALGELEGEELLAVVRALQADPALAAEVDALRDVVGRLEEGAVDAAGEGLDPLRRERILTAAQTRGSRRVPWMLWVPPLAAAATILVAFVVSALMEPDEGAVREEARNRATPETREVAMLPAHESEPVDGPSSEWEGGRGDRRELWTDSSVPVPSEDRGPADAAPPADRPVTKAGLEVPEPVIRDAEVHDHVETDSDLPFSEMAGDEGLAAVPSSVPSGGPPTPTPVAPAGPVVNGAIGAGGGAGSRVVLHLPPAPGKLRRVEASGGYLPPDATPEARKFPGGEDYGAIEDNPFHRVGDKDTSTFSIDVDTASYANVRRFLDQEGRLPPKNAVRIEELVNYFPYDYAPPAGDAEHPFVAHTAVAICPWEPEHRLVRIALKGKVLEQAERPAANLVFLLDVSGSMRPANKLPLVKRSMELLLDRLDEGDLVSIVVYAGAAGQVLPPTTGDRKAEIRAALDRLQSGGSTNGGAGIELAYRLAQENLVEGGVNRVILCTDGDFNVGVSNTESLAQLVERRAKHGVFLSILGFGMGNLKDDRMEQLSNRGNGNYGYVDNLREAQKLLVDEGLSTLVTIAKDVKIQIFFNPKRVAGWRLIGYENRLLAKRDFNDDTKDAGEIGAGHAVTALYEIVPVGVEMRGASEDPNPFVAPAAPPAEVETEPAPETDSNALVRLRLRYKAPDGDRSTLMEQDLFDGEGEITDVDTDFQWASAVAGFGMLLRDSPYKGGCSWELVEEIAGAARGEDPKGYRAECLQLMRLAASLSR